METVTLDSAKKDKIINKYQSDMKDIMAEFHANPSSRKAIRQRSALMDKVITALRREAEASVARAPKIAVIATGGYGRGELFIHSDIDVMFLIEDDKHQQAEAVINLILYTLWDLQLKVGHSVRSVSEAIGESVKDITIRTNLLEARRVSGSRTLTNLFLQRFNEKVIKGRESEFIEAKLQERAERHQKQGESRALLEPNVKEGKGGLRDLQTLMWLMRACYGAHKMGEIATLGKISADELRDFRRARKFLHLVRLHLHDVAGRAEERLTLESQRQIAERLGYRGADTANQSVERFMKRYFQVTRTVGQLTRTLCFLLEEEWGKQPRTGIKAMWKSQQLPDGLIITANRLHFASAETLQEKPELMIGIFWYLHRLEIDIHPAAWQLLTRNLKIIDASLRKDEVANGYFMKLLLDTTNPVSSLKRMNESGVLGKFIPDFGLLAGQMQFDLYHTFTVDEHILTALDFLHRLESSQMVQIVPLVSSLFPTITQRRVMILALFCHDIAKGRGGSHHLKGVAIGEKLAKRFGFDKAEQKNLAWLIEHHQHLSMVAFKRDLDDNQTIEDFAAIVPSLEMLNMLYAMTVADIHAVAPNIWNSWKGDLLETLYRKTERVLNQHKQEQREEVATAIDLQQALEATLPRVNPADITTYIEAADAVSLEAYDIATHIRIFPCWHAVKKGEPFGIRFKTQYAQHMTQVTIATKDKNGLFAQISGVFAVCGANIINARICTRQDDIVIDRFAIQNEAGQVFDEDRRQERICARLAQVLAGELDIEQALADAEQRYPNAAEVFEVESQIIIDNDSSHTHTLVEIHCADKRGLLYRVTNALAQAGCSISTAHIATYGEKVVDVFYIQTEDNQKLRDTAAQAALRAALQEVI